MIIPNKFNGYVDGIRTCNKGGGSNKAYKLEKQRLAKMQDAINAINNTFSNSNRQSLYDKQQQAVYDLNKTKLDEDFADATRNNTFALARNGLVGGSADIDSNADLNERYAKGLVEAEGLGQTAAADLQQADESAKSNLISLAEAGLDSGSAATQAASSLNSNYQSALGDRSASTISNYFNDMGQLYLANKIADASNNAYQIGYYGNNGATKALNTKSNGYQGN